MVLAASRVVLSALLLCACSLFELVQCQRKIPPKTTQISETKIRANFDCPEEFGYYPHPTDCTQYYVCVFGGALLESCTGGLMYSNELQTCDWPRNVGCGELAAAAPSAPASSSSSSSSSLRSRERESPRSREREDTKSRFVEDSGNDARTSSRTKYTPQPPPLPQPKAVVTSRGQPRQLQERQQEIIKQQQLYADVEESLPPAEEIESDRQQRVYRGQPSTIGQVQRDRDGYRNTNSLPTYKDRGEKIGVISFGTQSQLQHYSNETDMDEITENHLTLRTRRRRDAEKSRLRKDASPWQSTQHQNNRYLQYNPYSDIRGNKQHLAFQQDEQRFRPYYPDHKRPMFTSASSHTPVKYHFQTFQPYSPSEKLHPQPKDPYVVRYVNQPNHVTKLTSEQRYNGFEPLKLQASNTNIITKKVRPDDQKRQPSLEYTEAITKSYQDVNNNEKPYDIEKDEHSNTEVSSPTEQDDEPNNETTQNNHSTNEGSPNGENNPNKTSSYEYTSNDEYDPEDDRLGPPPSFFESKSKYEDIPNPFEDPEFDFDKFLEKLGSTTTTTTTTTTHRPVPIKIPVYENLEDEHNRYTKNNFKNYNMDNLKYANSKAELEDNEDHQESKHRLKYQGQFKKNPSRTIPINYIQNGEKTKTNHANYNDFEEETTLPYYATTVENKVYPKITNDLSGKNKNVAPTKLKEARPILTNYVKNVDLKDLPTLPIDRQNPTDYERDSKSKNTHNYGKQVNVKDLSRTSVDRLRPLDYEKNSGSKSKHTSKIQAKDIEKNINDEYEATTRESEAFTRYYKHQNLKNDDDFDVTSAYHDESRTYPKKISQPEKIAQTTSSTEEKDKTFIKKFHLSDANLKPLNPVENLTYTHQIDKHQLHNEDFFKTESDEKPKKFSSKIKSDNKSKHTTKKPPSEEYEYYYEYEDDDPTTQKTEKKLVPDSSNKIQSYQSADNISKLPTNTKSEQKYSARYQAKLTTPRHSAKKNVESEIPAKRTSTSPLPFVDYYSQLNTVAYSTPSTLGHHTATNGFNRNQYQTEHETKKPTVRPASTTFRSTKRTTLKSYKPIHTTSTYQQPDLKQAQSKFVTSDEKTAVPSVSSATATARTLYNSSQYNTVQNDNRYDPYYALYDDEVQELYRDVDYTPQQNTYTNANTRTSSGYSRGTPATVREETPSRGKTVYNIVSQDIYQPSTVTEYAENAYQEDDYRQSSRTPSRGDLFEINEVEDEPTTKRVTSTTIRKLTSSTTRITTTSTTTQAPSTTLPPKMSTVPGVSSEPDTANQTQALPKNKTNPGHTIGDPTPLKNIPDPTTARSLVPDITSDSTLHVPYAVVRTPSPFLLPEHLTIRDKPPAFHYITKAPTKSTHQISSTSLKPNHTTVSVNVENSQPTDTNIVPTTYSPPKYFLKSILPKSLVPEFSFRPISKNYTRTPKPTLQSTQNSYHKTLKAVRKLINPIAVNHELESSSTTTTPSSLEAAESFINDFDETVDEYSYDDYYKDKDSDDDVTFVGVEISPSIDISPIGNVFEESFPTTTTTEPPKTTSSTTEYTTTTTKKKSIFATRKPTFYVKEPVEFNEDSKSKLNNLLSQEKFKYFDSENKNKFRATIEVPSKEQVLDNDDYEKSLPDQPPSYKPKPIIKTDEKSPVSTTSPTRVSRVNNAIKSLIANGGTKGSPKSPKCFNDPQCKAKSRTNSRNRGTSQYSSGSIASNEVTVTANRGTPPPRARPTLKPSTSIVSKSTEFVDIYRNPPRRPDPLYPQPQPDKTAAKCRKDVCLLPDCSCGGKEIPGDIPVEQVPQIVLLTFDDSVNDLNKGLYQDLFERGRTNPNGCPISATFYVSHEWTDYSQVQNLYSDGHELASHTVSHSFGEQFSQKKWTREIAGQREILSAYGGVKLEDVRGMRAPFLSVGGNKMFKMLYDSNFTYDSSLPIYENKPPSWPYTLDYKLFHDCMIPPCPTRSYPGVWEVPMVMWQDLNGGRCSMGDACSNPSDPDGVFKMILKNFERHYTTNRAPFGLFYHAAWFTQPHHKEGFINFLDTILGMKDVWVITNWQAIQWVRDPTPTHRLNSFQPFGCDYPDRPKRCNNPKVCNLWHKSGVRYMRTCQPCPDVYPWTGNTGIRSSKIDNDIED